MRLKLLATLGTRDSLRIHPLDLIRGAIFGSYHSGPEMTWTRYHGLCGWVLGNFGLHAVFFYADSSADLLAVRIVSSFLSLHLAEFATKEINCVALEA
jgi:hypothetical protein